MHMVTGSCERPPKPPTFWNSYTRTLILDTIMKLSGTIGVTQKTMTLDTHVRLILLQTLNPQERWGTHKKRLPFQPRLFADVIGLVRCSCSFFADLLFKVVTRPGIMFLFQIIVLVACTSPLPGGQYNITVTSIVLEFLILGGWFCWVVSLYRPLRIHFGYPPWN